MNLLTAASRFSTRVNRLRRRRRRLRTQHRDRPGRGDAVAERLEDRTLLANFVWNTDADGDWSDAANWLNTDTNQPGVPGFGDAVTIDRGAADPTVTVSAGQRVATVSGTETVAITTGSLRVDNTSTYDGRIALDGGTLFGTDFTTAGTFDWTAGTFSGTLTNTGTMNISGDTDKQFGRTLNNDGTINFEGAGRLVFQSGGQGSFLNNNADGVFSFTADAHFSGASNVNNAGRFRKTGGPGESSVGTGLFNHLGGSVEATTGTLLLSGGSSAISQNAHFVVDAGAVIDVTGRSTANAWFTGTTTGEGEGRVELSSGTLRTVGTGATLDFAEGVFHWIGGGVNHALGRPLRNDGFLQIGGAAEKVNNGRHFDNAGTILHGGEGPLRFQSGGPGSFLTNLADATYEFISDADITGSTTVTNFGLFRKTGGLGESLVGENASFVHRGGTIEATSGTLGLAGSGAADRGHAHFIAAAGATIDLTGRKNSFAYFAGTSTGEGEGRVVLTTGAVRTWTEPATFDFPEGLFHWLGGSVLHAASGPFRNDGFIQISSPDTKTNSGSSFHNAGTIVHSDGPLTFQFGGPGSFLDNLPGGVYELGDGAIINGSSNFNNQGLVRRVTGGSEESRIDVRFNAAVGSRIEVDDGRVVLGGGGQFDGGAFNAHGDGVLELAGSSEFNLAGDASITGTGDGMVEFSAGTIISRSDTSEIDFADGLFHWTSGTFGGGGCLGGQCAAALINVGHMTLSGPDDKFISNTLTSRGTITHTGTGTVRQGSSGAVFENLAGGLWDIQGDGGFANIRFFNSGTLRKSAGAGESLFERVANGALNHFGGTVEVQTGSIRAARASQTGAGGHFIVEAGALLRLDGDMGGGDYSGEGDGRVEIRGRILANNDKPTHLDFPEGMLSWVGQTGWSSSGAIVNDGFLTIEGPEPVSARAYITNNGTVVQEAGSLFRLLQTVYIINHGLWDFRGDADLEIVDFSNLGSTFFNLGTLRKSAGDGVSRMFADLPAGSWLSNTGTLDVQSGTLDLRLRVRQFDVQQRDTTLAGGTWRVGPGSELTIRNSLGETPPIEMNNGDIILDGAGSQFPNAEGLIVNGGSVQLRNGRDLTTTSSLTNGTERDVVSLTHVTFRPEERLIAFAVDEAAEHFYSIRAGQPIRRFDFDGEEVLPAIPRPNTQPDSYSDLDFVSASVNIGGTVVPAGTLLYVSGQVAPPVVYGLDKDSGDVLAEVELSDLPPTTPGIAFHPIRGTIFILNQNREIREIDPATGDVLSTFNLVPPGSGFFSVSWGDLDVDPATGNLYVVGSSQERIRELTPTGEFVRDHDISDSGLTNIYQRFNPAGLAIAADGGIWIQNEHTTIARLDPFETRTVGTLRLGPGSTLDVAGDFTDVATNTIHTQISGRPATGAFGRLAVTGDARLEGAIQVELTDGFGPLSGDVYEIITYASRSGGLPDFIGVEPTFEPRVESTRVVLDTVATASDLAVVPASFTAPDSARPGAALNVSFDVANRSAAELSGTWTDAAFLSRDRLLSADDLLIGTSTRSAPVAGNTTYVATISGEMPAVPEGDWYLIGVTDGGRVIPDIDRSNNVGVAAAALTSRVPILEIGSERSQSIREGQSRYFRIDVPAGSPAVLIDFEAQAGDAVVEVFADHGRMPTRSRFAQKSSELDSPRATLVVGGSDSSPTYILIYGDRVEGTVGGTLRASVLPLELDQVSNPTIGNDGLATIEILGSQLSAGDVFELRLGNEAIVAAEVTVDATGSTAWATFELNAAAIGLYDLAVTQRGTGDEVALRQAVEVVQVRRGELSVQLLTPNSFRNVRVFAASLVYENVGNVDMPAPLITILAENGKINRFRGEPFVSDRLSLIGASQTGEAGVLRPGERVRVDFRVLPDAVSTISLSTMVATADSSGTIDWDAVEEQFRPAGMPDAEWDPFWIPFVAEAGSAWNTYIPLLARFATELRTLGGDPQSVAEALSLARQYANEDSQASLRGVVRNPLGQAVPGATLSFRNVADAEHAGVVVSRSDGSYVLPSVPAGDYEVTAVDLRILSPTLVTVPDDGTIPEFHVEVSPGAVLSGGLLQSESGAIVSGQSLTLSSLSNGRSYVRSTDESGQFRFAGLAAGDYRLTSEVPGFAATSQLVSLSEAEQQSLVISLQAQARIIGRVSTGQTPVVGRVVAVRPDGSTQSADVSSDGTFVLDGLSQGDWMFRTDVAGRTSYRDELELAFGGTVDLGTIDLAESAGLTITLRDATGAAMVDRLVTVTQADDLRTAVTNDAGVAELDGLTVGEATLSVKVGGLLPASRLIDIEAGENTELIQLSAGARVFGRVNDRDGVPIPNIDVQLIAPGADGLAERGLVSTDETGAYEFLPLEFGTYAVTVGNGAGIHRTDVVLNSAGAEVEHDFSIGGGTIRGVVELKDGTPVPGANVVIAQDGVRLATAEANGDGQYTLRGFAAGDYTLIAASEPGVSEPAAISLTADEDLVAPDLTIGSFTLTISVTDPSGAAPEHAIALSPAEDTLTGYAMLDSGSSATSVTGLVAGDYLLRVESAGLATLVQPLTISGDETLSLQLDVGSGIAGTVTNSSGDGVDAAIVSVFETSTMALLGGVTSAPDGTYELPAVADGDVLIRVEAEGLEIHTEVVTVTGATTHDVVLNPAATTRLVQLVDSEGAALADARVDFVNAAGITVITGRTSWDGTFSTTQLPTGVYDIHAALTGYFPESISDAVVDGSTDQPLEITLQTAGTDDITRLFVDVSEMIGGALSGTFLEEKNPEPMRHHLDLPLPPLEICDPPYLAKEEAMVEMIRASQKRDVAYRQWQSEHTNFNVTTGSRLAELGVRLGDLVAQVYGIVQGGALSQQLADVSPALSADRATTRLLQLGLNQDQIAVQTLNAINQVQGLLSGVGSTVRSIRGSDGSASSVIGAIGTFVQNTLSSANGIAGLADLANRIQRGRALTGPASRLASPWIGVSLKAIDLIKSLAEGYQEYKRLCESVPHARTAYLSFLNEYVAARGVFIRMECPPCRETDPDCEPPPPEPPDPGPQRRISVAFSSDPNDKLTVGLGEQGHIRVGETITYTIRFENMRTAQLPAQEVRVSDTLSENLDWSTLELLAIGFNNVEYDVPEGLREFEGRISVPTDSFPVDTTVTFDSDTGDLNWYMRSVDPLIDDLPEVPEAGFLPPNDDSGRGEGFLMFRITVRDGLGDGDVVHNRAAIIFDDNETIVTNTAVNTIDDAAPESAVGSLPPISREETFVVNWAGDDGPGSGVASFDVFVSEDNGPFVLWLNDTTDTSAEFTGTDGSTHRFYSTASDLMGFEESAPVVADAQTTIDVTPPTRFRVADVMALEGGADSAGRLRFVVSRTDNSTDSSVRVTTADGSAESTSDYASVDQVVEFEARGAMAKVVWVSVTGDLMWEPDETLTLNLSEPENGAIDVGSATGTIRNDDPHPPGVWRAGDTVYFLGTKANDRLLVSVSGDQLVVDLSGETSSFPLAEIQMLRLDGAAGHDIIDVQAPVSAVINGGPGHDVLTGSMRDDTISAGPGNDIVRGRGGNDFLTGGGGRDQLAGGSGNDVARGGGDQDTITGGQGDDALFGGNEQDVIFGNAGNDRLVGFHGADDLFGGDGDDHVSGGRGLDFIQGDAGDDELFGGGGRDEIDAGSGADFVNGGSGGDSILGGDGDDVVVSGAGVDVVRGDGGNDLILGGDHVDRLSGDSGRDILIGGRGADVIDGGGEQDVLLAAVTSLPVARLRRVLAEWTSGRDYAQRLANISGIGSGSRANGKAFLTTGTDGTVRDDRDTDELVGGDDADWFFASAADVLVDRSLSEELSAL